MSDLISRSESVEELEKYEKELQKDKVEAIETDDENMLFAITNQLTAICRIKRNIMNMPTACDIDRAMVASAKAICVGCGYLEGTKCTYTGSNCGVSKPMLEAVMKALEQIKAGGENEY